MQNAFARMITRCGNGVMLGWVFQGVMSPRYGYRDSHGLWIRFMAYGKADGLHLNVRQLCGEGKWDDILEPYFRYNSR